MDERTKAAIERMRAAIPCEKHVLSYELPGALRRSLDCDKCAARVLHAGVGKVTEAAESSAVAAYARKERSPSWTVKECIVAAVRGALAAMIGEPPETER